MIMKLLSFVFCVLVFSFPLYSDETEITEVQVGFESYYRPGYWCPINLKISTGNNAFQGYLKIITGNLEYKNYIDMSAKAHKEISLPVLMYLPLTEIKLYLYHSDSVTATYSRPITIKPVETNRFLIGVEKKLFSAFREEFSRYTEAAQHSCFFAFSPDEFFRNWQILEGVDLLVVSEDTLHNSRVKDVLELWQKGLKGNLLVMRGLQVDLREIKQFNYTQHDNPGIAPEIYNIFEYPRWFQYSKQSLYKFITLYFLLTIIVFIIGLWIKTKPRFYIILSLIGLNVLSFSLVFITGIIPPDFITERLKLVTANTGHDFIHEYEFISINSQRSGSVLISLDDEFTKPLYPDANGLEPGSSLLLSRDKKGWNITSSNLKVRQRNIPFILKQERIKETEKIFELVDQNQSIGLASSGPAYFLINKTNLIFDFDDCFILSPNGCGYFGKYSSGEMKPLATVPDLEWGVFLNKYLPAKDKASRYQRRLLEMWYKKFYDSSKYYLIGWNNKTANSSQTDTVIEYPELWIIPIIFWQ